MIRKATSKDIDEIISLVQEVRAEYNFPEEDISDIKDLEIAYDEFFVAEIEGKIVGSIAYHIMDGFVLLRRFYVLKNHQGKGIGRALLEKLPSEKPIISITEIEFTRALKLYQKAGFEIFKTTKIANFLIKNNKNYDLSRNWIIDWEKKWVTRP